MRRTTYRRPVRLTEAKLRQIIRETIEQDLIQEANYDNIEKTMKSLKSLVLAAGLTFTPAVVGNLVNDLNTNDHISQQSYQNYANNMSEKEKAAIAYVSAKNMRVSGPPSHHSSKRSKKEYAIAKAEAQLKKLKLTPEEAQKIYDGIVNRDEMYAG